MSQLLRPAAVLLLLFTVLTGAIYPAVVTGLAQLVFSNQANGSLIEENGQAVGSALIGQPNSDPRYFWPRPSATAGYPYNAAASGGSNLGPTNPALLEAVQERVAQLESETPVPVDLVTSSASGLDPHLTPAGALVQIPRIAQETGLSQEQLEQLVAEHTAGRQLGVFGEPRVNVLQLNLALAELIEK
jgi:K+-transporting ATPase ATPase C chain